MSQPQTVTDIRALLDPDFSPARDLFALHPGSLQIHISVKSGIDAPGFDHHLISQN